MAWFSNTNLTKMKTTYFRHSISSLLFGEHGIVSVKPKLTFNDFNCHFYRNISKGTLLKSQEVGNECLKQSVYGSSDEDDDFIELGAPVSQSLSTNLKLVTEKYDRIQKFDHARKVSWAKLEDIHKKQSKPVRALPTIFEEDSEVSRVTTKNDSHYNYKRSSSVIIEKIPSVVSLPQLKEAVSKFGKVLNASMRTVPEELDSCYIEFESIESSRKAVSSGKILVESFCLSVRPPIGSMSVTIRISNIGLETAFSVIHSMCMSYGPLEGFIMTKDDEADAIYKLKNNLETLDLLQKLQNTKVDNCQWSAELIPSYSSLEVTTHDKEDRHKWSDQIKSCLTYLKSDYQMKRLHVEDFETLHLALVDLETQRSITS